MTAPPGPICVSSGDSSRAARFGADFLFQHSWLFLPSKQGVGLLAALPASIACILAVSPALLFTRLLFSATDTPKPSQKCQRWALLVPENCSWASLPHVLASVSACAAAAKGIAQLNWSLCYMWETEDKVCMLYFLYGMALKFFCPRPLLLFKQFSIP